MALRIDVDKQPIRLEALDGVRGVAALFVAWFHIYQRNEYIRPEGITAVLMHWTSEYGWLGVQAFFVITGFVIPYSVRASRYPGGLNNALRFLGKRGLRLYPPFAAAVVLTFVIILAAPYVPGFRGEPFDVSMKWFVTNFTLTAPYFGEAWANTVFWSLLVEAQFYIVVAVLFGVSPLLKQGHFSVAISICVLSSVLSVLMPWNLHSVVSWAPYFVVGYLLYQYVVQSRRATPLLAVGSVAVASILSHGQFLELVPVAITAALILLRWSPGRVLLGLGAISYSLYLIHYPVGVRAVRLFARIDMPAIEVWSYMASLILVVFVAWIFYMLFERPSLRMSRSIQYKRARPQ